MLHDVFTADVIFLLCALERGDNVNLAIQHEGMHCMASYLRFVKYLFVFRSNEYSMPIQHCVFRTALVIKTQPFLCHACNKRLNSNHTPHSLAFSILGTLRCLDGGPRGQLTGSNFTHVECIAHVCTTRAAVLLLSRTS